MSGHGHVIPNTNGMLARCGGPALCGECAEELANLEAYKIEELKLIVLHGNGLLERRLATIILEIKNRSAYKPKTTQIQRAEMLKQVKEKAYGPGYDLLRGILMDLDAAEAALKGESERSIPNTDDHPLGCRCRRCE